MLQDILIKFAAIIKKIVSLRPKKWKDLTACNHAKKC